MSLFRNRSSLRSALGAPETPQQVITTKGHLDRIAVRAAINNSRDHTLAARSYPGGGITDNHVIQKHDVTVGFRSQRVMKRLLNHPNLKVFVGFNGFNYQHYPTDNHITRAIMFTGVALDIETYDANRKDSGLALQIGGIYTITNTGNYNLKPGQLARIRVPPTGRGGRGGVPMSQLPMDAWNPGEPRGKLPVLIEPYNPRDMNMVWTAAYATMFRSADYARDACPGILGAPYRQMYDERAGPSNDMRRNTSHQDEAGAVKYGMFGIVMQAVFALVTEGYLQPGDSLRSSTPNAADVVRALCGQGVFDIFATNPDLAATNRLEKFFAHIFWRHIPDRRTNAAVTTRYRNAFASGFQGRTNTPSNNFDDTDANIARMFTDSLSMLGGMINGAAQEERSTILGKVTNDSISGEGVTIVFGMRNQ